MQPFEELTYHGRIRRMRRLARSALDSYGFTDARFEFLRQAGNTLFLVNASFPSSFTRADLYLPGRYLLRVHQPGYQAPSAIRLELEWLSSMCREAALPVPQPVLTLDGDLCVQLTVPGIPGERICSLLRWVKGRELKREAIRPHHYKSLGQLMAGLHHFAASWQFPAGLSKRQYDWQGLFRQAGLDGISSNEVWSLLPTEYIEPFEIVSRRVKRLMDGLGKGPDVYGLIHADIGMGANVLFWDGDVRLIDFDDSGFGYYIFDLAIVLEDSQDHQIQPRFRQALLDGYTLVRPLPDAQLRNIDLFLAAYAVYWSLYAVDVVRFHPQDREEIYGRMARYFRLMENFLANG